MKNKNDSFWNLKFNFIIQIFNLEHKRNPLKIFNLLFSIFQIKFSRYVLHLIYN